MLIQITCCNSLTPLYLSRIWSYFTSNNIKKRTRYDILSSFLSSKNKSNQFKNKYQVRQAVKNINYELEEAEKEFEKLFKADKEYE